MKGAFLVTEDVKLFEVAKRVLLRLGGQVSADDAVAQLRDETGGLFTVYRVPPEAEWEFKTGKLTPAPRSTLPDMSLMKGIAIECRNEFTFVTVVRAIAKTIAREAWVVDGDGMVWCAREVNPAQIRLLLDQGSVPTFRGA